MKCAICEEVRKLAKKLGLDAEELLRMIEGKAQKYDRLGIISAINAKKITV